MTREQTPRKHDADRLYKQFVKPLEKDHKGKYVTVSLSGDTIISPTLLEAIQRADDTFGRTPTVTFKVGEKVVGKIR
jgi:hypothetical protein